MYGKKGPELLKELASSERGLLSAFNNDLFAQVIEECTGHLLRLGPLISLLVPQGCIWPTSSKLNNQELEESEKKALKAHNSGALIHHLFILRNKRCLIAYVITEQKLYEVRDGVLREFYLNKLRRSLVTEKEFCKNHGASLQSYMSEIDLDLALDMVPPKDPYIKVRVLEDIGNVVLSNQSANLAHHAILFLRRTDAEQYISQGLMEELTG